MKKEQEERQERVEATSRLQTKVEQEDGEAGGEKEGGGNESSDVSEQASTRCGLLCERDGSTSQATNDSQHKQTAHGV
jgi:hypothetical protein